MDEYFVLYCSDDGTTLLCKFTEDGLKKALAEGDFGRDMPILTWDTKCDQINLQERYGLYILKGPLITPRPKQVVTAWEL
jgi:hypothetical protein